MENAADALKIAFSVLMFVLALTLSISCFSQANTAVKEIINLRDETTQYTYVEPSENLTRIVGVETVITTMYKAYEENFEVRFYKENGDPLPLYYKTDSYGNLVLENSQKIEINYINLEKENFGIQGSTSAADRAKEHLDFLLSKESYRNASNISDANKIFEKQLMKAEYPDGLYEYFANKKFEESLGEYEQGQDASKITKRVVTFTLTN